MVLISILLAVLFIYLLLCLDLLLLEVELLDHHVLVLSCLVLVELLSRSHGQLLVVKLVQVWLRLFSVVISSDVILLLLSLVRVLLLSSRQTVDLAEFLLNLLALTSEILIYLLVKFAICSENRTIVVGVAICTSISAATLPFVLLENSQRVWKLEVRLLHLQAEHCLVLVVLIVRLNIVDSENRILVTRLQILNFLVCDQSLIRLFAFFVEDSKVVPDFGHEGV